MYLYTDKITVMAIVININENIEQILLEAEKLTDLEQKEALAYMRAVNMQKKKRRSVAKFRKGLDPVSMEEIDRIKHESRNNYAK